MFIFLFQILLIQNLFDNFPKTSWAKSQNDFSSPFQDISIIHNHAKSDTFVLKFFFKKVSIQSLRNLNFSLIFNSEIVKISYKYGTPSFPTFSNSEFKRKTKKSFHFFQRSFQIPVTGTYRVSIKFKDFSQISIPTYSVLSKDLSHISSNYSTLDCIGPYYEHRWCKATNICWNQNKETFIFYAPLNVHFKFNRSLMTPGSRPIPNDYPSCRTIVRFNRKMNESLIFPLEDSIYINNGTSYITCRWYSTHLLWHALFDYTLPLYWIMKLTGGPNITMDRIFLIDTNNNMKKGMQMIDAFSKNPPINIRTNLSWDRICFKNAIIGFPKCEKEFIPNRYSSPIDMPYEYPPAAYEGFKEFMMEHYLGKKKYQQICKKHKDQKRIVFLWRVSPKRHIENKKELLNAAKQWCPDCIIDSSYLENLTIGEQMEFLCNASMLIGNHGGGLSHMVWLQHPSAIIEIFPYGYTCRNWYKQIADGTGVNYFAWINPFINNTKTYKNDQKEYFECLHNISLCFTNKCHDILRDQITTVDIDNFKETFMEALHSI